MVFFLNFENTKNGRKTSNQPTKPKLIQFQVVSLFLTIQKLKKSRTFAPRLPEKKSSKRSKKQ
jgi:hypothetical protein